MQILQGESTQRQDLLQQPRQQNRQVQFHWKQAGSSAPAEQDPMQQAEQTLPSLSAGLIVQQPNRQRTKRSVVF